MIPSNDIIEAFLRFSADSHMAGSGIAPSYVRALNKLDIALKLHHCFLRAGESIWNIQDNARLIALYEFVKAEQKKPDGGIFKEEPSPSYWRQRYCSSAIKCFSRFLTLSQRQNKMLSMFETLQNGTVLAERLESTPLSETPLLLDDDDIKITSKEGKTAIREVEIRQNQNVFRKMILRIYQNRCCITGLPIPEILRVSHISPWALDKKNRMNPENGLCLSATYDAAFDRYLISLDEDYRLIFAPSLKDYCTNASFKEYFEKYKGCKISMPIRFLPSQKLLEQHRNVCFHK